MSRLMLVATSLTLLASNLDAQATIYGALDISTAHITLSHDGLVVSEDAPFKGKYALSSETIYGSDWTGWLDITPSATGMLTFQIKLEGYYGYVDFQRLQGNQWETLYERSSHSQWQQAGLFLKASERYRHFLRASYFNEDYPPKFAFYAFDFQTIVEGDLAEALGSPSLQLSNTGLGLWYVQGEETFVGSHALAATLGRASLTATITGPALCPSPPREQVGAI